MADLSAVPRIFVMLPSYRDPECHRTITDLFAKAAHPERVFVGLVWQYDAVEDAAYLEAPYPRAEQVRSLHFPLAECKGAGWARAQSLTLWQGEEYILQIQAHSRFESGWDEILLDMLHRCPSPNPVVAFWPPNYTPGAEGDQVSTHLQRIRINAMGGPGDAQFVHLTSDFVEQGDPREGLYPTPYWIGCFMFARSEVFHTLPADPHIFFWGEEIAYSARLWTHGYDLFQNDRPVVYHQWFREGTADKQEYRSMQDPRNQRTCRRIRHLLGLESCDDPDTVAELNRYGLGNVRTLESFFQFAGIDLASRTATLKARRGYFDIPPDREWGRDKILVLIASYRDPECQWTIKDLYERAARPERVYVGICWQFDAQEDAHCFEIPYPYPDQVREFRVDHREALGVCWARWMTQNLWRGEEYILQIDSHMRFVPGWDEAMIQELAACPSEKPVLSCCIARYTPPNDLEPDPKPVVLRVGHYNHEGNIRTRGAYLARVPPEPLNEPFISAGFIFARAEMIEEVPYDPFLYFEQEEIMYAARLFTHGWDVFSSRRPFVYHYYIKVEEKPRPLPWLDARNDEVQKQLYLFLRDRGLKRMNHLTGFKTSKDKQILRHIELFGFGTERTVREFENYCGLDLRGKRSSEYAIRARFVRDLEKYIDVKIYAPEIDDKEPPPGALMSEEERLARLEQPEDTGDRPASGAAAVIARLGASASASASERIFVQIASYRDPECQWTVKDLFEKAAYPDRVTVGICWQADAKLDKACFEEPCPRPQQMRVKQVAPGESQGVGWARAQALMLWQGEEYILQIDSHMRFEPGWDALLLDMFRRAGGGKSAVTAFLPNYEPPDVLQDAASWLTRGKVNMLAAPGHPAMVHLGGDFIPLHDSARGGLYPTPFVVGSFLFGPAMMFRQVPPDPQLYFHGDEIALSARLWTHGYDLYQPDANLAYHRWTNAAPHMQAYKDAGSDRARRSFRRVQHLLGLDLANDADVLKEIEAFGHGVERDLESFWRFAGVDLEKRELTPEAQKGTWNMDAHPKRPPERPRIFVQIASYRDPECQWTVKDLFEKAAYPDRITVGICWQFIREEDAHCFTVPYPRPGQVRVIEMDAREAKGVCWARARLQELWQGEEYTLQIDSHMRFEQGWDEMLIDMLTHCESPKSIITSYPAGYTPPHEIKHRLAFRLVAKQFDAQGIFTMTSRAVPVNPPLPAPVKGAFASACMLFGPASIIRDVPYDPHLYFFGEEITLSARLWTHGYEICHPNLPVMYHYWERKQRRTHFDDHQNWPEMNKRSYARVRHLLGAEASADPEVLQEIDHYGLGTERSLAEYQTYAGVDFAKRHISKAAYDGRFPADQAPADVAPQQSIVVKPVQAAAMPPAPAQAQARPAASTGANGHAPVYAGPRKVLETPGCVVYDDFLPPDIYEKVYGFASQTDYQYINTQGKVKRVWDITNGFPLRSEKNVFYYHDPAKRPEAAWVYPTKTGFDPFVEHILRMTPNVERLVGVPGANGWEHFSVTGWIYPQNTGLSMHDDGSGIYSGAYVFFMNDEWRPHWGGMLLVMDEECNRRIQQRKKQGDAYQLYLKKWLHLSDHDEMAMDVGLAQCVFPKANRMVFIHPDTFHMVTQVAPAAGDHVRMSLAGFFHRGKKDQKDKPMQAQQGQGMQPKAEQKPPELYE